MRHTFTSPTTGALIAEKLQEAADLQQAGQWADAKSLYDLILEV